MMENNRPLQNLSVEEICELWKVALTIDDKMFDTFEHLTPCCYDVLLNSTDINHIRAGVILHAKLCKKYGIPFPEIKLDLGRNEGYFMVSAENEDDPYEREVFEYMRLNLHRSMDSFASLQGIGDFTERSLRFDSDVLKPLLEGGGDAEKEIDKGFLSDELTYSGYRSVVEEVRYACQEVDVMELKVTESKNMALLNEAVKKGDVPENVKEFWNDFQVHTYMRTYYWCQMKDMVEIKGDTWCSVYAILNFYEEGLLIGDLYKLMSVRIGAYIAQELAERYGVPLAA